MNIPNDSEIDGEPLNVESKLVGCAWSLRGDRFSTIESGSPVGLLPALLFPRKNYKKYIYSKLANVIIFEMITIIFR